jgi:hypothetical protein
VVHRILHQPQEAGRVRLVLPELLPANTTDLRQFRNRQLNLQIGVLRVYVNRKLDALRDLRERRRVSETFVKDLEFASTVLQVLAPVVLACVQRN